MDIQQFSLRSGMLIVSLLTLALGISQYAIQLIIFATAFTVGLMSLEAALSICHVSKIKSLLLGMSGACLIYAFSVGPVLLSCRFLEHGLPQPNIFESCSRFFDVFFVPVYELAEAYAETPISWYSHSWLLDRSWMATVSDPAYVMFLVFTPWMLVFALLSFVLFERKRKFAAFACGTCYVAFFILAAVASASFW